MSTKTTLATIWQTPDDLWKRIAPVLGPEKAPGSPGRPATSFRLLFDALVYVLRTGCQGHAIGQLAACRKPRRGADDDQGIVPSIQFLP